MSNPLSYVVLLGTTRGGRQGIQGGRVRRQAAQVARSPGGAAGRPGHRPPRPARALPPLRQVHPDGGAGEADGGGQAVGGCGRLPRRRLRVQPHALTGHDQPARPLLPHPVQVQGTPPPPPTPHPPHYHPTPPTTITIAWQRPSTPHPPNLTHLFPLCPAPIARRLRVWCRTRWAPSAALAAPTCCATRWAELGLITAPSIFNVASVHTAFTDDDAHQLKDEAANVRFTNFPQRTRLVHSGGQGAEGEGTAGGEGA